MKLNIKKVNYFITVKSKSGTKYFAEKGEYFKFIKKIYIVTQKITRTSITLFFN